MEGGGKDDGKDVSSGGTTKRVRGGARRKKSFPFAEVQC